MTRLKSISIQNFKAYKSLQEIPLKPITLIFGPNSAGKSTITHALAFLKHAYVKNGDCNPDEVDLVWDKVTLGGWQNLVHGHDSSQSMHLGLQFGENVSAKWTFEGSNQGPRASQCVITQDSRQIASAANEASGELRWQMTLEEPHPIRIGLEDRIWNYLWTGDEFRSASHKDSPKLPREQFSLRFLDHLRSSPITTTGLFPGALNEKGRKRLSDDEWCQNGPRFPDPVGSVSGESLRQAVLTAFETEYEDDSHLQELFRHCVEVATINGELSHTRGVLAFEQLFQSHIHLGPSREAPPRDIDHQSLDQNSQFGPWLELLEKKNLREQVNQALDRLGLNYEIVTRWKDTITYYPDSADSAPTCDSDNVEFRDPKKQLAFQIKGTRVTLSHRDLGYGVSMVLPILVALNSSEFDLITMEQPELHIHPRQQAELGDELIAAALRHDEPKQLIIETHSEHLILRILRRIRETAECETDGWPEALREACQNGVCPEDITVLYVQPGTNGSKVIELPVTTDGDFSHPWPGGFFAERDVELF